MVKTLLCTGKYAVKPYRFENICVNVYCIEELCYLLSANPFIIDAGIMDRKLAEWIDAECGLTELAHQLLNLLHKGIQPGIFVDTILDYVNYNTQAERERIREALQGSAGLTDMERAKKQGDYLIKNNRYQLAIGEYDRILLGLPEAEGELRASVYHNMGVAYGNLFQFESAARYYKRAYEISGKEESGIQYLIAQRKQMSEGEYITFLAENSKYYELSLKVERLLQGTKEQFEATRESRMLSALKIYKDEGNTASYYEEIDRIISGLKEEYRDCVTG